MTVRWLFADQLGPLFTADVDDDAPVLLVESLGAFRRRRFHRRKADLVLSALRHRAAELGDRAVVVRSGTHREALDRLPAMLAERGRATDGAAAVSVVDPTSRAAREHVHRLAGEGRVEVLPERGWVVAPEEFATWVTSRGRRRLLLDDFYRHVRLQRGYDPVELTDWFHRSFVDGFDWVMVPNVVGMSQHADGGLMATKPYASGGAYLHRMTDHCGGCPFDPEVRLGPEACPFTAGYWAFLHRNAERFAGNHRMGRALAGLRRLDDLAAVVEQEARRDRF